MTDYEVPVTPGVVSPPPDPAPPVKGRSSWPYVAIGLVAALILAGVAVVIALPRHSSPAAPAMFAVTGSLTLEGDYTGIQVLDVGRCNGKGGYSDLREGAQVVVTDPAGKTVALGSLEAGAYTNGQVLKACVWAFHLDGVPAGLGFYGVEVSHRGRVQYPEAEMRQPLSLSIGS